MHRPSPDPVLVRMLIPSARLRDQRSAAAQADSLFKGRAGCDGPSDALRLDVKTNLVGSHHVEFSAKKLREIGRASNCFGLGIDPTDSTHIVRGTCTPQYDMTDVHGNKVRNTHMKVTAELQACDVSEEAMSQAVS